VKSPNNELSSLSLSLSLFDPHGLLILYIRKDGWDSKFRSQMDQYRLELPPEVASQIPAAVNPFQKPPPNTNGAPIEISDEAPQNPSAIVFLSDGESDGSVEPIEVPKETKTQDQPQEATLPQEPAQTETTPPQPQQPPEQEPVVEQISEKATKFDADGDYKMVEEVLDSDEEYSGGDDGDDDDDDSDDEVSFEVEIIGKRSQRIAASVAVKSEAQYKSSKTPASTKYFVKLDAIGKVRSLLCLPSPNLNSYLVLSTAFRSEAIVRPSIDQWAKNSG